MSDIAIKVENLSKKYLIGRGQSGSLRETLSNAFHNTFGGHRADVEEFWALRDVSFEVKQGEAVGIIGRNGAGKSTLLKLLSKITYPTSGKITMNGRVSSLLEVGTGFHPELTGRENIYLNGTILGMSRREVKSKFDEIVAFSGVEKFLDTPVKRYSSGMYVRLAFAVAAHLEPEILIIDEVLAVGDIEFQKKCLGKMDEVAKGGRTVLFVSHSMNAIQKLCNKGILLNQGKISTKGNIDIVIDNYLTPNKENASQYKIPFNQNLECFAKEIEITNKNCKPLLEIPIGNDWIIKIKFTIAKEMNHFIIAIGLLTSTEIAVQSLYSKPQKILKGDYIAEFYMGDIIYSSGQYSITVGLSNNEKTIHYTEKAAYINISEVSYINDNQIIRNKGVGIILNSTNVKISKA